MNKIEKAFDVLFATDNPKIKKAMVEVLREEIAFLQSNLDDIHSYNEKLCAELKDAATEDKCVSQSNNELSHSLEVLHAEGQVHITINSIINKVE